MKEEVLKKLNELGIAYKEITHKEVFTIEEMDALGPNYFEGAKICKNLFVRDQKGKRHFLVVVPEEKRVALDKLAVKLSSTKLSFASSERLDKYLKLSAGSVTPLAVINDVENAVEVIFDLELKREEQLGVHPCVNTATLLIKPADIETYVKSCGNQIKYISL